MSTFKIITANVITKKGITPFVGLTVLLDGKEELIARTCKQTLMDLHKSARASNVPAGIFDNGVENVIPLMYNKFNEAVIGLVGKIGMGSLEIHEAGDEYEATEFSSAVREGRAKVGEILKTEKRGVRTEGFLAYPLTEQEVARREAMENVDQGLLISMMLGIPMPTKEGIAVVPSTSSKPANVTDPTPAEDAAFNGFNPEEDVPAVKTK